MPITACPRCAHTDVIVMRFRATREGGVSTIRCKHCDHVYVVRGEKR